MDIGLTLPKASCFPLVAHNCLIIGYNLAKAHNKIVTKAPPVNLLQWSRVMAPQSQTPRECQSSFLITSPQRNRENLN